MCVGDLKIWPKLVDRIMRLESSRCVLFEISEGLSALDHIKPISNEFGIRGRIPRYKLGRYGPHSSDALLEVDTSSDVVGNASIKAQILSRMSSNIARCTWACISKSRTVGAARDSSWLHLVFRMTHCIMAISEGLIRNVFDRRSLIAE